MNTPVKPVGTARQEALEIREFVSSVWDQRAIVLLFVALFVAAAVVYVVLATPEYSVETKVRPVARADLDELNRTGLYTLSPKDALVRVGSSMQSYDVRLNFFRAHPQYLEPLQGPGQSLEEAVENFGDKAFTLENIEPGNSKSLTNSLLLTLRYSQGVDGVGVLRDFTDYVLKRENEKISSDLKRLVANRTDQIEKDLASRKAAYQAGLNSQIAALLEQDQLKKQRLQDELKALRQQLQSRKQNRLKELDEAIVISKKLGIVNPTTPSSFGDDKQSSQSRTMRAEVNSQAIPLYFMGQLALEAERETLKARRSEDFTEPRINEIQKELSLLETNREVEVLRSRADPELFLKEIAEIRGELVKLRDLRTNFDNLELARVDKLAMDPLSPVNPKKTLIVGFGLLFGLLVGLGVVVARRSLLAHQPRRG